MRKHLLLLSIGLFLQISLQGQCGSAVSGGTATGFVFSFARNGVNPVVADKTLNTVAFVHRTQTVTTGNMGQLVYDISTNGGATWTPNLGLLNPIGSSQARFPSLTIYNPPANTVPNNAYVGYMAATFNTVTSLYNGVVSGVRQISGTGNTENYNQPVVGSSNIAASVVKGAPGVFWAVDGLFNGTVVNGLTIYKGVWSNITNDIVWSNNFSVSPGFNTGVNLNGQPPSNWNIAFDPTGTTGYMSFMGHLASGPAGFSYYPILYKTTNGGASWTGPIVVDINQFSCLTGNTTAGLYYPTTSFEHDLIVDVNGNPHIITLLMLGNNAYAVYYALWHHLYDITLKNGLWAAYDLANAQAGRGLWGTIPNNVDMDLLPRIARSADGTKIFYTWADNSGYTAGQANQTPNLFSKAYNVTTDMWTQTLDFTSCNVATAGKIIYPNLAPEVLEPSAGQYKLAIVYGEFSTVANDPALDVNYKFLDNVIYAASDFSIATPSAPVSIQPGPILTLCQGSSITLSLASTQGQFQWSNGSTSSSITISAGSALPSYSVIAQQDCYVGTSTVTVKNLTLTSGVSNPNICPGGSETFTVAGNAFGYTWTPSSATGTNVVLSPTTNTVTVTALGSASCTETQTVLVNMQQQPTLSIAGTNTICTGMIVSQTVTGASTYLWSDGSTSATFTDSPMTNTVYVVKGTAANTCTNAITVSVTVKTTPTLNINASALAVCKGQTVGLTAVSSAVTYSWDAVNSPPNIIVTPQSSTVYTATGAAANLCEVTKTIGITVNALPVLTVTPAKPQFCKGEKIKLTASGAANYTWTSPGVLSATVQVNPINTTTYSVTGKSADGCTSSTTFQLVVEACTGIDEHSGQAALMIYPNPNNGLFTIKGSSDAILIIYNELGQVVQSLELTTHNKHEVNIKELPSGIYFVSDQKGISHIKQKIVVAN